MGPLMPDWRSDLPVVNNMDQVDVTDVIEGNFTQVKGSLGQKF